jgi:hypothetical protein
MRAFLSRLAFAFAALLIASAVFVGACGFLCYAIFLYLAELMPPALAALATAGALIALAVVVLFIGRGLGGGRRSRRRANPEVRLVELLEAFLGADLAATALRSPYAATGIAFFVGLLFGVSPRLRRIAAELLHL